MSRGKRRPRPDGVLNMLRLPFHPSAGAKRDLATQVFLSPNVLHCYLCVCLSQGITPARAGVAATSSFLVDSDDRNRYHQY